MSQLNIPADQSKLENGFDIFELIKQHNNSETDTIMVLLDDEKTTTKHVIVLCSIMKNQNDKTIQVLSSVHQHPVLVENFSRDPVAHFYTGCAQFTRPVSHVRELFWGFQQSHSDTIAVRMDKNMHYLYSVRNGEKDFKTFKLEVLTALKLSKTCSNFAGFLKHIMFPKQRGSLERQSKRESFHGIVCALDSGISTRNIAMRIFGICVQSKMYSANFTASQAIMFVQDLEAIVCKLGALKASGTKNLTLQECLFNNVARLCKQFR